MEDKHSINWETVYSEMPLKEMGWYLQELDHDIEAILLEKNINSGTFLDLGSGPGTQAKELAEMGLDITGTDISEDAVRIAQELTDKAEFIQDDVLNSKLDKKFDYIIDRGCFHVFSPDKRPMYVKAVQKLLNPKGTIFLKCFSNKEPEDGQGPNRISPDIIKDTFKDTFKIESIKDSYFKGTREPRALFVVLKKKLNIK